MPDIDAGAGHGDTARIDHLQADAHGNARAALGDIDALHGWVEIVGALGDLGNDGADIGALQQGSGLAGAGAGFLGEGLLAHQQAARSGDGNGLEGVTTVHFHLVSPFGLPDRTGPLNTGGVIV